MVTPDRLLASRKVCEFHLAAVILHSNGDGTDPIDRIPRCSSLSDPAISGWQVTREIRRHAAYHAYRLPLTQQLSDILGCCESHIRRPERRDFLHIDSTLQEPYAPSNQCLGPTDCGSESVVEYQRQALIAFEDVGRSLRSTVRSQILFDRSDIEINVIAILLDMIAFQKRLIIFRFWSQHQPNTLLQLLCLDLIDFRQWPAAWGCDHGSRRNRLFYAWTLHIITP